MLTTICLVLFANTFQNDFVWDDKDLIVDNKYITDCKNIPLFFTPHYWNNLHPYKLSGRYRPLRTATFAIDYYVWKLNPAGYHLTNLLLHIINVLLVYYLVFILSAGIGRKIEHHDAKGLFLISLPFLTALFFATHPVHTESINFVKSRSDLLAFLFYFLSFIFFVKDSTQSGIVIRRVSFFVSLICFFLALVSKEMALSLPGVLILYSICFLAGSKQKKTIIKTIPFIAIVVFYFWFRQAFILSEEVNSRLDISLWQNLLAIFKTVGYYLQLLVLPINLNSWRSFPPPETIFTPAVISSIGVLLVVGIMTARAFTKSRIFFFSSAWIFVTLVPASNIIYLASRPIAEQRLYIPSFGFCLLLALGVSKIVSFKSIFLNRKRSAIAAFIVTILICLVYSVITVRRNVDWRDDQTFFTKIVSGSPGSPIAYYNLGTALSGKGYFDEAIEHYNSALRIDPSYFEALNNIGEALAETGRFEEAISKYLIALQLEPYAEKIHNNIGVSLVETGRFEEAVKHYKIALQLKPDYPMAYYNIGNAFLKQGKYEESISYYSKVLKLDPGYAHAQFKSGLALEKQGRHKDACQYYSKAIVLDPAFSSAYYHMGISLMQQGHVEKSIGYLSKAVTLNPDNAEAYLKLGIALMNANKYSEAAECFEVVLALEPGHAEALHNLEICRKSME